MPKILIDKDGYVDSMYKHGITEIDVDDETAKKLTSFPMETNWRFVNNTFVLEVLLDDLSLKKRREYECFKLLDNRSKFWYDSLSKEQYLEVQEWYQAWLDVTETKVIPKKPEWLN